MKAQVLIDFIMECTIPNEKKEKRKSKEELTTSSWILHVNGASNFHGSGARLIFTNLDGVMEYALSSTLTPLIMRLNMRH